MKERNRRKKKKNMFAMYYRRKYFKIGDCGIKKACALVLSLINFCL